MMIQNFAQKWNFISLWWEDEDDMLKDFKQEKQQLLALYFF